MVKQAAAFDRSIARFDASWDALKRDLATSVLPALTATTEGMRKLFDELKNEPEIAAVGAASLGALYARRKIMKRRVGRRGGGGIAPGTAAQIEGASAAQKSASTTFAEAVAEFRAGVREMAARGNGPGGAPVKEAEKEGENFASKLKSALPALVTGTVLGAVGVGITAAILNRDQSKSLVDGGRPDVQPWDNNLGLPGVDSPTDSRPTAFRVPDAYNREMRARGPRDTSLDGFVMGSLEKPVLHLANTLKTASATFSGDGVRSAAFHPAALGAALAAGGPADEIAAAVKEGTLAAFREWAGMQDIDGKAGGPGGAGGGGFTQAAFHPGGGMGRGGGLGGSGGGNFDTSGGGTHRATGALGAKSDASEAQVRGRRSGEGLSQAQAARALVWRTAHRARVWRATQHRVHRRRTAHPPAASVSWDSGEGRRDPAAVRPPPVGAGPRGSDFTAAIWAYRNSPRSARTMARSDGGRGEAGETIRQARGEL